MAPFAFGWHALITVIFAQPMFQTSSFANIWGGGKPIDGGKTWKGKRIFGDNKTWRGFIVGMIGAIVWGAIISFFFHDPFDLFYGTGEIFPCAYPMYIGIPFGLGNHLADLMGSFVKRRINIKPGGGLFPWDQMGYILTGFALAVPFMLPLEEYFWYYFVFLAGATFFMHMLVSFIAYKMGLKRVWW